MTRSTTSATDGGRWLVRAAALPPLVLAVFAAVALAGAAAGWHPLWPEQAGTLSELAALKDRPGMLERLRAGDDPSAVYDVRAELVKSDPLRLTPLEAAITTREDYIFDFLVAHGARHDGAHRARLMCFAREMGADRIIARLAEPGVDYDCAAVSVPWRND